MTDNRIIENINKLKALGMSNEDIIENLVGIGLSKEESRILVENNQNSNIETKKDNENNNKSIKDKTKQDNLDKKLETEKPPKEEEIPNDFFSDFSDNQTEGELEKLKEISSNKEDDLSINLDLDYNQKENEEIKKPELKDDIEISKSNNYNDYNYKESFVNKEESLNNNEFLWQKGLLTTINSKFIELEAKQKEIDDEIDKKIKNQITSLNTFQENIKKEIKINLDKAISQEANNLNKKIITDLAKFKITESKINSKIQSVNENKEKLENIINNYEGIKEDLTKNISETKNKIDEIIKKSEQNIAKLMTNIAIKLNQKTKEFDEIILEQSKKTEDSISNTEDKISKVVNIITEKLNNKTKEINSTLALQTKITEGLIKNTQNSVNLELKKLDEFEKNFSSKIDFKKINERLIELDNYKEKLSQKYDQRFNIIKDEFLKKAKIGIKEQVNLNINEIKEIKEEIFKKTDPKILDEKLNNFEKKLKDKVDEVLTDVTDKSIESINQYMSEFNKTKDDFYKNRRLQREIDEKLKDIDTKIINQTKLTQDLVDDTEKKIEVQIKKIDNFQKNVVSKIDPKRIYETITEIEEFKVKISKRFEERFNEVKKEFLDKAKVSITNVVKDSLNELETVKKEIVSKTDPEIIEKKLIELEKFELSILESIDSKVMKAIKIYQASLDAEFKEKMTEIDNYKKNLESSLELQMKIKEEIKEIELFKKQFIAVIDENIEKMNKNMQAFANYKK